MYHLVRPTPSSITRLQKVSHTAKLKYGSDTSHFSPKFMGMLVRSDAWSSGCHHGYLLQRDGQGQGPGGENIIKGGTDLHTKLISHQNTHFDVTLKIDHDRFRHTSLSIRCHIGLGHLLSCSTAQVTVLRLPCLRLLVGTAVGLVLRPWSLGWRPL